MLQSMGSQRVRHDWVTEQRKQSDQKMSAIIQLLYSTGNYAQYLIITYNGKEYEKEYIYTYLCISLCYTPETNITL